MSSSDRPFTPHDPLSELDRLDAVTLMALGEPIAHDLEEHIRGCATCLADVVSLQRTVELGRASAEHHGEPDGPADAVWDRISDQLGIPTRTTSASRGGTPRTASPRWRRRVLIAAAAIAITAGGAVGGYIAGHNQQVPAAVTATAQLSRMPGAAQGVRGVAVVHDDPVGSQLSVTTSGLPLRNGFYEVWLFDPDSDVMVPVGTLARDGSGSFPVPPGLDVNAYHIVDISAQDYNGNPAHGTSILRGTLTG